MLKVKIRQFNYYNKKHTGTVFTRYGVDSGLTRRYTPGETREKYDMTYVVIRSQMYRNNTSPKKEHGQMFYSKLHFDLSENSGQGSRVEYYTTEETMKRFKLSRDLAYGIL